MPALSSSQIDDLRAFADTLADAARAVILPYFRTAIAIEQKEGLRPGFNPVTAADKAAEAAMRKVIERQFPTHGIIGEEFDAKESRDGLIWYLDPIDGTQGFVAGLPLWGTLIGLAHQGRPIIGVIDQGYIGERFRGWPGGADFVRDGAGAQMIRVRSCEHLSHATISTTDPLTFKDAETGGFEQVRATAKAARYGCDCYAYAMLAGGHMDLVIESGLAPWDVAALVPVVEGAGGMITNWRGAPVCEGGWFSSTAGRTQAIAAGDARAHAQALPPLKRAAH